MCLSSLASKLQKLQQATESRNPITAKTQFISNSGREKKKKNPVRKQRRPGFKPTQNLCFLIEAPSPRPPTPNPQKKTKNPKPKPKPKNIITAPASSSWVPLFY